jgi:hypothetical protein
LNARSNKKSKPRNALRRSKDAIKRRGLSRRPRMRFSKLLKAKLKLSKLSRGTKRCLKFLNQLKCTTSQLRKQRLMSPRSNPNSKSGAVVAARDAKN